MPPRGLAAGVAGRAVKRPDPKVVAAPVAADQPPPYNPKDDSGPIAPQEGPQTRFLACGADIVMYGGAAGGGKLLATDTLIPTPHGWTTMGELSVGDTVFDERGQPCTVQYLSPVVTDAIAYRLTFSDGTTVTACAEHLWHTYTAADLSRMTRRDPAWRAARRDRRISRGPAGKKTERFSAVIAERNRARALSYVATPVTGEVRTTQSIVDTLRTPNGRTNHAIPVSGALDLPAHALPIDPYVLGVWLGDGESACGRITTADMEVVEAIREAGYEVRPSKSSPILYGIHGLTTQLRDLGVLGAKHVPAAYLRSSVAQRMALLQGLMDTDGTIGKAGGCDFDNTNRQLAEAVFELVASLGMQPRWSTKRARLYGKDCGESYRVQFTPTMPVFRLPRKLARQRPTPRRTVRFRYILAAERVPSVPMRCAQVSSPSRLYLCSRAMIPTHNTTGIVMEATRHQHVKDFAAVYFRRTYGEIFAPRGIWDESKKIFGRLGWTPKTGDGEWITPAGGRVWFTHLVNEDTVENHKSAQYDLIAFDQLETFTRHQFFYMLSRSRSTSGVVPYVRAVFNPEPGWLADFLQWWWDPETGYPIPERDGVIRWMTNQDDEVHWGDTREELIERFGEECDPLSVTFIRATLEDNKILMEKDPKYKAKLKAMPLVEQERLIKSNFKITPSAGMVLPIAKFNVEETMPTDIIKVCRGWDNAASKKKGDFSAAIKLGLRKNGRYIILHGWRDQVATGERDEAMRHLAVLDGRNCEIAIAQEPGSAGKDVVFYTVTGMAGFTIASYRDTGEKLLRIKPFASQLLVGNVDIFCWNREEMQALLYRLNAFPTKGVPDDDVDALGKAFKHLTIGQHVDAAWYEDDTLSFGGDPLALEIDDGDGFFSGDW